MTRIATLILAAALALAASCGGSSTSSGGAPNVDGNKQVSAATAADKASVCDWFVGMVGGYGFQTACADAFIEAPATQAECTDGFPTCAVPFATFETCVRAIIAAQETCTTQSLSDAHDTPACQTVDQASCF
jgi:hypothetical protein